MRWCCIAILLSLSCGWGIRAAETGVAGLEIWHSSPSELCGAYHPVVDSSCAGTACFPPIVGASFLGCSEEDWLTPVVEFPIAVPGPEGVIEVELLRVAVRQHSGLPRRVREVGELFGGIPPLGRVPDSWVEVVYGGIARDRHLGYVRIRCARPLPELGATEVLEAIEFCIRFAPERAVTPPLYGRDRYRHVVVNDDIVPQWYSAIPLGEQRVSAAVRQGIPAGTWLRLGVREEGIYRITAQQLEHVGIRLRPEEVATVKIFGTGGEPLPEGVSTALADTHVVEIPILVRTNDKGELVEILFYGAAASGFRYQDGSFQHFRNPYSDINYYLLTWGGELGQRVSVHPSPQADTVIRPSTYTARIFWEEELFQPFSLGSGRDWFGPILDPALPVVYTTPLPDLERSGEILYRFVLVNRATVPAEVEVVENGYRLWRGNISAAAPSAYVEAISSPRISVRAPASVIAADGRSILRFSYKTPSGAGSGHVDWVEIHYPRRFTAIDNAIGFFTDPSWSGVLEFSITGFSGEVLGFDVTDPRRPQLLQNMAHSPGVFVFRTVQQYGRPRRFFLSARFLTPTIERAEVLGLRQRRQGAPLIIVTHRDLWNSAEAYQRYRAATGTLSVLVPVDALYNEFAAGMPDPTAVRNFLAAALATWEPPPQFVLFWGDGHYDYRGISTRQPSYVPTYQSSIELSDARETAYNAISSYTTDDYFTWLQGEDVLPDVALGRLPIGSDEEGFWMLEKIRRYEQQPAEGSWRSTITLVADDGPTTGGASDCTLHTAQSEELSERLPSFLFQRKIYLAEYPAENIPGGRRKPAATQDLVAAVNTGTLLLNWIGHGNPRLWAHEQILERETTIPLFQNVDRLFFLTAATCDFARFDNPQVQSGAEAMVLSRVGGAIGAFSAARLVYAGPNARIMQYFYAQLFRRRADSSFAAIGEVCMATKLQRFDLLNDRKYVLLADPVLRLVLPMGHVLVDSLNGVALRDSLPTVRAWERVRLCGRVLSPQGDEWDDASGRLVLIVTDAPREIRVPEPCGAGVAYHVFRKLGNVLHYGIYSLHKGRWEAEFIVPQEVSFSSAPGHIFAFAFAEDGRTAGGLQPGLRVSGSVATVKPDTVGPYIRLYLDDPSFRPGDLVRSVPELIAELWDESGINTSGTLGRRIEAWIDEDPTSLDLTPLFQPLPGRPGAGVVRKPLLGLSAGMHSVRLRAWDVYGNFSVAETFFRIVPEPSLADPLVIPNPVHSFPARFSFLFSGVAPVRAEFLIADPVGAVLYRRQFELLPQRRVELTWDGMTDAATPVASGTYVYRIRLLDRDGSTVAGTFVVVR